MPPRMPKPIYIIGAQCTGKTTLLHALSGKLAEMSNIDVTCITELAREILKTMDIDRTQIQAGTHKAMLFQTTIMEAQNLRELSIPPKNQLISDRSALDPIVYAKCYGGNAYWEEMLSNPVWREARDRMRGGLVIVCQPVSEWLFDDGVRLMAKDFSEWCCMHETFILLLNQAAIRHFVIPLEMLDLEERIKYVLGLWEGAELQRQE